MTGNLIATRHRCLGRPTASGFIWTRQPAIREVPVYDGALAWVTWPAGNHEVYWYPDRSAAGKHRPPLGATVTVSFRAGYRF